MKQGCFSLKELVSRISTKKREVLALATENDNLFKIYLFEEEAERE